MGRSKVFYILSQPEFNYSNHSERIELVIKGILKFNKKHLKGLVPLYLMLPLSMSCFNRYSSAF